MFLLGLSGENHCSLETCHGAAKVVGEVLKGGASGGPGEIRIG